MEHNSSLVNLSIPQSVTQPIVAAKIQEAVLAALGGSEQIISAVIKQICETKVNSSGQVSSYSSDNKFSWLDYHVTEVIQKEVKQEIQNQLAIGSQAIKEELIRQLQTKKGASKVAEGLLSSLNGTFAQSWSSKIEISFESK